MMQYEPNVIIPLAPSYNTRGVDAYTNAFTNGLDQRKINMVYRPVKNAMTGGTTFYLCKRPGTALDVGNNSFGTSGQVAYLNSLGAGSFAGGATATWVYSTSGNDVRASSSTTTTVVATAAGSIPLYVDKTSIGGTDTVVLQIGSDASTQTVWYSTAIGTFTQITDGDFPDVTGKMEFLDGYAFAALDSSNVQRIYNSDLNSLANWTSTNYITKQIQQDRVQGLMRLGNMIIAGGQNTLEIFRNAGLSTGSPLESIQQLAQRAGMETAVAPYYCTVGTRVYFYGRFGDSRSFSICSFDGARVERVSTPNIEGILAGTPIRRAIQTVSIQGRQAVSISLALPSDSTQHWLMFFPDYNEWFEWTSTVVSPIQSASGWLLGVGANQHKLYNFPPTDNWQDNAANFDAVVQFVMPDKGNHRKFMPFCGVKGDTASLTLTVKASDVDGAPGTTLGSIDMSTQLKVITRCGTWKGRRTLSITNPSNAEGRMESFFARIE